MSLKCVCGWEVLLTPIQNSPISPESNDSISVKKIEYMHCVVVSLFEVGQLKYVSLVVFGLMPAILTLSGYERAKASIYIFTISITCMDTQSYGTCPFVSTCIRSCSTIFSVESISVRIMSAKIVYIFKHSILFLVQTCFYVLFFFNQKYQHFQKWCFAYQLYGKHTLVCDGCA